MKRNLQRENGFALLLALIISSVVLAIGVSILNISINQINLSATARESEFAFQAAHAGVDCMWYWRNEDSAAYTSLDANTANPSINCFNTTPTETSKVRSVESVAGNVDRYINEFEWGSPARCTKIYMFVMNAYGGDVTQNFGLKAIGTNGSKTCLSGNVCTVLVSDGYNRSCADIDSSIFSVQRELTVEF